MTADKKTIAGVRFAIMFASSFGVSFAAARYANATDSSVSPWAVAMGGVSNKRSAGKSTLMAAGMGGLGALIAGGNFMGMAFWEGKDLNQQWKGVLALFVLYLVFFVILHAYLDPLQSGGGANDFIRAFYWGSFAATLDAFMDEWF
jgi:hypothetical protein